MIATKSPLFIYLFFIIHDMNPELELAGTWSGFPDSRSSMEERLLSAK